MGVFTYVEGLKPTTEEYEKKLKIYKLCNEFNISVPKEILDFFADEICEEGIPVELPKDVTKKYTDDSRDFLEVNLKKLPKEIEKIRFVNSY